MSDIFNRVCGVVSEKLNIKPDDIQMEHSFTDDLGADSLDTVEIVMALEEEFDVEIPDEDAENINTVEQAVTQLTERLSDS